MNLEAYLIALLMMMIFLLTGLVVWLLSSQKKTQGHQEHKKIPSLWMEKLCSRKLWVAIGGFLTTLAVTWGVDEISGEQLMGTCMALSSLLTYIAAEGYADGQAPSDKFEDNI